MNQYTGEIDPLSICDYSMTYSINPEVQLNSNNQYSEIHTEDISQANLPNNIQYNEFDVNSKLMQLNVQDNLPNEDIKREIEITFSIPNKQEPIDNSYKAPITSTVEKCNDTANEQNNGYVMNNYMRPNEKGRRSKIKKERSSYWSEKIAEKDFPFYGCAVCNICFVDLTELDKHIATHKDRTTSYDLRVKNQLKRKKMKKEKKKLKKLKSKEIKEENDLDIEIKPEDGYIGSEKASEFENKDKLDSNSDKTNTNLTKSDIKNVKDGKVETDQHMLNLEKIFKCFACQKQFTLSYYLKLHVRSHTDEKPYTCAKCGQSFITASKLGRHNKRFHLQIKYQCRICYRYFSRFECLTAHFDRKHPDDKIEGEPYDFNAILPYLKELEEELKQKSEQADAKPKDEWMDGWTDPNGYAKSGSKDQDMSNNKSGCQDQVVKVDNRDSQFNGDSKSDLDESNEDYKENVIARPIEIILDELKPEVDSGHISIEIKAEAIDHEDENFKEEDHFRDDDDHFRNDDDHFKDDDQFKVDDKFKDLVENKEDLLKKENSDSEAKVKNESTDDEYFPSNTWVSTKEDDPPAPPDTDPLTCRVCSKKIKSTSYMKIHMRTHTGEKPFKCYICNSGFITSSKMHRHVLTHSVVHTDGTLQMKKEEEREKGEDKDGKPKTEGEESEESNDKTLKRGRKPSKKPKSSAGPKTRSQQKRPHACEYCHQRFLHLDTLQVHKKSHEGQPLVYKCKFCLADMADEGALRAHEATHAGAKPYLCTICGKTYKKKETMVYHRKHHKPENLFVCSICSKTFNAKCKYSRHALTHRRAQYSLRYECPVCAHMFHTQYHVRMHLTTHQREGLIVEQNRNEILAMVLQNARKIPKKDPAGTTDSLLPADERSRVCNICGEVFQHFYYLEEHLKNHASKIAIEDEDKPEDKKHVCPVCNKSFKLHYYLKLHSFTHTKEKPYICQQCGKGFITRGKLKRHLETHAGLKKFQCHVCYKFFTRPSYLRTHVRTIHGTQDYNFRLTQNLGLTYPSSQQV